MKSKLNIYTAVALALGFGAAKLVDAHYWDALVSIPTIFLITFVIIKLVTHGSNNKLKK